MFSRYGSLFTLITLSQGVLNGLTNDDNSVAFFSPFSDTRYFLPFTPIENLPIGVRPFFG